MKMDLQTRYVPFWNGISVSNSLILSNLFFCWFFINTVVKNVFAVFYGPDSIALSHSSTGLESTNDVSWKSEN